VAIRVPLSNSLSFTIHHDRTPVFNFPNLRILSLNNIHYDARNPSPSITPLVALLKGSPSLTYLELSLRHQIGGLTMAGDFRPNMYGNPNPHTHVLITLCLQYRSAGGQPLRLKALRLGYGCELWDYNFNPLRTPHYLNHLANLAHLEELHMEGLHNKDGSTCPPMDRHYGYTLVSSRWYPHERRLTGLRKMTWPWSNAELLTFLKQSVPAHLRPVVLRIDKPAPSDWNRGRPAHPGPSLTWAQRSALNSRFNRQLTLGGLVLPAEFMTPQDGDNFLTFVPWVKPTWSLKIRMPPITGAGKVKSYKRTFWSRMGRTTELRELWFADGLLMVWGRGMNSQDPGWKVGISRSRTQLRNSIRHSRENWLRSALSSSTFEFWSELGIS